MPNVDGQARGAGGVPMSADARANDLSRNASRTRILELQEMASKADWDGEGSVPLDQETVEHALQFADCLPAGLSDPEIDASPHGTIDFEWTLSRQIMLSVSMCPDGTIASAFRSLERKTRSTAVWSREIPEDLMVAFNQLQRECGTACS